MVLASSGIVNREEEMKEKIAYLFPGQGAQFVGMGADFYQTYPEAAHLFDQADVLLGWSLSKVVFEGPEDSLRATDVSQLALFVTSLAMHRVVEAYVGELLSPDFSAGLSLGEYTALTAAGALSFEEGLRLVEERGRLMRKACQRHPGSMSAVIGLGEEEVATLLAEGGEKLGVSIANLNCPQQVVISGRKEGLEWAKTRLLEGGARRVIPLNVDGAFHSSLMTEAREEFAQRMAEVSFSAPSHPVISNVTAEEFSLDTISSLLVEQLTSPVRWEASIRRMEEAGVTKYLEIGPGNTLTGMVRRIVKNPNILPLGRIEEYQSFAETLSMQGTH